MTSDKTLIASCLLCPTGAQAQLPVCKLIATGSTIAMKIDPVKKAPVPAISGEDLIATVPQIGKVATIEVENLSNVPSDYKARIVLEEGVSRAESDNLFRSRSRSGNRRRSLS